MFDLATISKQLDRFFVGFDDQFDRMHKLQDQWARNIPNYPPCNIKKTGDNTYVIELAAAGFTKSDIEITLDEDALIIKGQTKDDAENSYLYQGIANRPFTRAFSLSESIQIKNAEMLNGMLRIFLEKIIPESKKPRKIEVQEPTDKPEAKEERLFLQD
jgi:molecular chaperone IbpA